MQGQTPARRTRKNWSPATVQFNKLLDNISCPNCKAPGVLVSDGFLKGQRNYRCALKWGGCGTIFSRSQLLPYACMSSNMIPFPLDAPMQEKVDEPLVEEGECIQSPISETQTVSISKSVQANCGSPLEQSRKEIAVECLQQRIAMLEQQLEFALKRITVLELHANDVSVAVATQKQTPLVNSATPLKVSSRDTNQDWKTFLVQGFTHPCSFAFIRQLFCRHGFPKGKFVDLAWLQNHFLMITISAMQEQLLKAAVQSLQLRLIENFSVSMVVIGKPKSQKEILTMSDKLRLITGFLRRRHGQLKSCNENPADLKPFLIKSAIEFACAFSGFDKQKVSSIWDSFPTHVSSMQVPLPRTLQSGIQVGPRRNVAAQKQRMQSNVLSSDAMNSGQQLPRQKETPLVHANVNSGLPIERTSPQISSVHDSSAEVSNPPSLSGSPPRQNRNIVVDRFDCIDIDSDNDLELEEEVDEGLAQSSSSDPIVN